MASTTNTTTVAAAAALGRRSGTKMAQVAPPPSSLALSMQLSSAATPAKEALWLGKEGAREMGRPTAFRAAKRRSLSLLFLPPEDFLRLPCESRVAAVPQGRGE